MTERGRFEEWYGTWRGFLDLLRSDTAPGKYAYSSTQDAWEAWQAALQPPENPGATHWDGCALTGPKHYACLLRAYRNISMSEKRRRENPSTPTPEAWFSAGSEDAEEWDGPYTTREAASLWINEHNPPRFIARGKKPDAETLAQCIDLAEICERIDDALSEEWWSNDGPLIEINNRAAAEAAMVEWVRQHLSCAAWTIDRTTIEPVRFDLAPSPASVVP